MGLRARLADRRARPGAAARVLSARLLLTHTWSRKQTDSMATKADGYRRTNARLVHLSVTMVVGAAPAANRRPETAFAPAGAPTVGQASSCRKVAGMSVPVSRHDAAK